MNHTIAPCCYFKTGVLFLDDDIRFIESLKFYYKNKLQTYFANDVNLAMHLLENHALSDPLNSVLISIDDICSISVADSDEEVNVFNPQAVNISFIYQKIRESFRNPSITLVVSDYFMPKMSGHEFLCDSIKKYVGLKSVMLTGEATMDQAIAMVNDGILDAFIKKNDPNFLDHLNNQIQKLQIDFFVSCTKNIRRALPKLTQDILSHKDYKKIFFDFFSNDIKYSALLDEYGSMVLKNENGKYYYFILKTRGQMEDSVDLASQHHIPLHEIKKLKEKKSMLLFFTEDSDRYKIPSVAFIDAMGVYYAVIESLKDLGVEK